jgi:hypothetical protein
VVLPPEGESNVHGETVAFRRLILASDPFVTLSASPVMTTSRFSQPQSIHSSIRRI